MKIRVALNGTAANPFDKWGLKYNPIPQTAKMEYDAACLHLQKLGGEPVPSVEYIRKHLEGWDPEFVELCCQQFVPGEYVAFEVEFPEQETER